MLIIKIIKLILAIKSLASIKELLIILEKITLNVINCSAICIILYIMLWD